MLQSCPGCQKKYKEKRYHLHSLSRSPDLTLCLLYQEGKAIQTPLENCICFADRQRSPMEIIPENLFPFLNRDGLSQQFLIRGVKGKKWLGGLFFFTERRSSSVLLNSPTMACSNLGTSGEIRWLKSAENCLGKFEKYRKIELFSLNLFGSKAFGGRTRMMTFEQQNAALLIR